MHAVWVGYGWILAIILMFEFSIFSNALRALILGHPKALIFPFRTNRKLIVLGCPNWKHIRVCYSKGIISTGSSGLVFKEIKSMGAFSGEITSVLPPLQWRGQLLMETVCCFSRKSFPIRLDPISKRATWSKKRNRKSWKLFPFVNMMET